MLRFIYVVLFLGVSTQLNGQRDLSVVIFSLAALDEPILKDSIGNLISFDEVTEEIFWYENVINCFGPYEDKFRDFSMNDPSSFEIFYPRRLDTMIKGDLIEVYANLFDEDTGIRKENAKPIWYIEKRFNEMLNKEFLNEVLGKMSQNDIDSTKYKIIKIEQGNYTYPITNCISSCELGFKGQNEFQCSFNGEDNCIDSVSYDFPVIREKTENVYAYSELIKHSMSFTQGRYIFRDSVVILLDNEFSNANILSLVLKDNSTLKLKSINETKLTFKKSNN